MPLLRTHGGPQESHTIATACLDCHTTDTLQSPQLPQTPPNRPAMHLAIVTWGVNAHYRGKWLPQEAAALCMERSWCLLQIDARQFCRFDAGAKDGKGKGKGKGGKGKGGKGGGKGKGGRTPPASQDVSVLEHTLAEADLDSFATTMDVLLAGAVAPAAATRAVMVLVSCAAGRHRSQSLAAFLVPPANYLSPQSAPAGSPRET